MFSTPRSAGQKPGGRPEGLPHILEPNHLPKVMLDEASKCR